MICTVFYQEVIPADRDTVFETVPDTTANWPKFFTGFKPFVGAITSASIEGGGPVVPGARRLIGFSDGTRIVEQILDHDRPSLHHYRVPEMTKIQAATMSEMDSTWEFLDEGGQCRIRWTYRLTPKSILTAPLVATVGAFGFRGAMRNCLATIRQTFSERQG
jgi:hypothetical protein